jgi:hypothetical protein
MNPKWAVTFASALAVCLACVRPAVAQLSVTAVPAAYRGLGTCPTKYPGSFLDLASAACWECPATHPKRTIFIPITVAKACERPARTVFRKASGPRNPTGLVGADCKSGWFLHWNRKCYSCGSGYVRTAQPDIAHARACMRVIPPAWTTATRMGKAGCPAGAFRNGLTPKCYACPPDYVRNALIADDLTKVNACTKLSAGTRNKTEAKFLATKDSQTETRDSLGAIARSMPTYDRRVVAFDVASRGMMKALVDGELLYRNGFDAVSWMVSGGGAVGLGYTHGFGYVMTKVQGAHQCRKAWSNTFTAGPSVGLGFVIEIALQKGVTRGSSESNGWQVMVAYPPTSGGWGLHWDAEDGSLSSAYNFGPAAALDVTFSEYAHAWSETGKVVDCELMTWGNGWTAL